MRKTSPPHTQRCLLNSIWLLSFAPPGIFTSHFTFGAWSPRRYTLRHGETARWLGGRPILGECYGSLGHPSGLFLRLPSLLQRHNPLPWVLQLLHDHFPVLPQGPQGSPCRISRAVRAVAVSEVWLVLGSTRGWRTLIRILWCSVAFVTLTGQSPSRRQGTWPLAGSKQRLDSQVSVKGLNSRTARAQRCRGQGWGGAKNQRELWVRKGMLSPYLHVVTTLGFLARWSPSAPGFLKKVSQIEDPLPPCLFKTFYISFHTWRITWLDRKSFIHIFHELFFFNTA